MTFEDSTLSQFKDSTRGTNPSPCICRLTDLFGSLGKDINGSHLPTTSCVMLDSDGLFPDVCLDNSEEKDRSKGDSVRIKGKLPVDDGDLYPV